MIGCSYCHGIGEKHHNQCPNYEPPISNCICSECGHPISIGDNYIENDNCEYAHWECIDFARDLARFLGYEIKEMGGDDY